MFQAQNTREGYTLIPTFFDEFNNESLATSPAVDNSNILSPELRASFEALRSLQQCDNSIDSNSSEHYRQKLSCRAPKRRNLGNSNLKLTADDGHEIGVEEINLSNNSSDDAHDLAATTFFMIQGEISQMVNKIAELEALLLTQSENVNNSSIINVIEFEHQEANSNNDLNGN